MTVEVAVDTLAGIPAPSGAHGLAWSYMLNHIFADAFHARIGHLRVSLPTGALRPDAELRATFSADEAERNSRAVALLGGGRHAPDDVDRLYVLEFGSLAPWALRRVRQPRLDGFNRVRAFSVFTLSARLLGVPIRVAGVAHRHDLVDRLMAMMRRQFASERILPSYYRLSIWERA